MVHDARGREHATLSTLDPIERELPAFAAYLVNPQGAFQHQGEIGAFRAAADQDLVRFEPLGHRLGQESYRDAEGTESRNGKADSAACRSIISDLAAKDSAPAARSNRERPRVVLYLLTAATMLQAWTQPYGPSASRLPACRSGIPFPEGKNPSTRMVPTNRTGGTTLPVPPLHLAPPLPPGYP